MSIVHCAGCGVVATDTDFNTDSMLELEDGRMLCEECAQRMLLDLEPTHLLDKGHSADS